MSNLVALTERQLVFFNYFKEYQQTHGFFPTPSQAVRDLRSRGVKCSGPTIDTIMGNLFLKGAFTGGQPLSWGNRHRTSAKAVSPIDVTKMSIRAKPVASVTYAAAVPQQPAQAASPLDGLDLDKLKKLLSML